MEAVLRRGFALARMKRWVGRPSLLSLPTATHQGPAAQDLDCAVRKDPEDKKADRMIFSLEESKSSKSLRPRGRGRAGDDEADAGGSGQGGAGARQVRDVRPDAGPNDADAEAPRSP